VLAELPLDSLSAGKLGEERVGRIEDGGVMELWEDVSIVEDDFPETSSTLGAGVFWKLALDRRRSSLKNGIASLQRRKTRRAAAVTCQERARPFADPATRG
jgi:hypothetical protein